MMYVSIHEHQTRPNLFCIAATTPKEDGNGDANTALMWEFFEPRTRWIHWALWRGVYFVSERNGWAAKRLEAEWVRDFGHLFPTLLRRVTSRTTPRLSSGTRGLLE
jgi:hypothetical protein